MINTYINDFKWHINYLSILIWYSCSNLVAFTTIEVESNQKKKIIAFLSMHVTCSLSIATTISCSF